jgi:hypothetical protein
MSLQGLWGAHLMKVFHDASPAALSSQPVVSGQPWYDQKTSLALLGHHSLHRRVLGGLRALLPMRVISNLLKTTMENTEQQHPAKARPDAPDQVTRPSAFQRLHHPSPMSDWLEAPLWSFRAAFPAVMLPPAFPERHVHFSEDKNQFLGAV